MDSAEARARWLRNANNCVINEDYKGVTKTCSLPSSSSKSEFEGSPSNLLPDTRWWLNRQPDNGDHYVCSPGHVDVLESEVGVLRSESLNSKTTHSYGTHAYGKDTASSLGDPSWVKLSACMENEGIKIEELEAVISGSFQKKTMSEDMDEFGLADDKSSNKIFSELESHWVGVEKNEPWWRTADIDELASFVSYKSLEYFENCDLPGPQRKGPQSFDQDKGLASLSQRTEKEILNVADLILKSPSSVSMGKESSTLGVECSPHVSDVSTSRSNGFNTTKANDSETLQSPNTKLSKAQLLEALCHSQTRAREAEKAAQEAYDEKEHIIQLFFRQASQLFAYKQWLQILQLETLCLQLRYNKNQSIYTRFPDFLPWVPTKSSQPSKGRSKRPSKKKGPTRYGSCAAAFIIGLSLAGAGLLLGWTMGWLFPAR